MWPPNYSELRKSNKANMRLWVAALRSGEYKQTNGTLAVIVENEAAYCCLGVACEVAIANGVPLATEVMSNKTVRYDGSGSILPVRATEFLGLEYGDPLISLQHDASTANDKLGWDFNRIADAIEEWYGLNDGSE